MSYLVLRDYRRVIQITNLYQVIGSDLTILADAEQLAQSVLISKLVQEYQIVQELSNLTAYSYTTIYKAGQRIYLDATAYNATALYSLNDLALQGGNVYVCTTAITIAEDFDTDHWTLIGAQYSMYYAAYPNPIFDLYGLYAVGDIVWYADKTYTCLIPTIVYSHQSQLQSDSNSTLLNVVPGSPNGAQYWGTGTDYTVDAGTLPSDIKWTPGDSRNADIINCFLNIVLFELHSRISPNNVPEVREKRYDDTMKWLKDAATGTTVTIDLPRIQPLQGSRIRYTSQVKQVNNY